MINFQVQGSLQESTSCLQVSNLTWLSQIPTSRDSPDRVLQALSEVRPPCPARKWPHFPIQVESRALLPLCVCLRKAVSGWAQKPLLSVSLNLPFAYKGPRIPAVRQNCPGECNSSVLECKLFHVGLHPHNHQTAPTLVGSPNLQNVWKSDSLILTLHIFISKKWRQLLKCTFLLKKNLSKWLAWHS